MQSVKHLVKTFAPRHYDVRLDLTKSAKRQFAGEVNIKGELVRASSYITLHATNLTIHAAFINETAAAWQMGPNDELILKAKSRLKSGPVTVRISFSGQITEHMHGIYSCHFTLEGRQKELIATQFESHHAREVLPCIDEPAAKATFDLTLVNKKGLTALANTPPLRQKIDRTTLTTTFKTTPKMSTYLLAFVVGDLAFREAVSKNGVVVRAYATPNHASKTQFAADLGAKLLDFYDAYFDEPFPLPKCDMVALPDFSSGAMENWGLITYRESTLLVDDANTPQNVKQYVSIVIAHELAHQWFGNLVTMAWWDDLWLNESFANWMEYYALDHFYPEWNLWEQFSAHEQTRAFSRDSLAHVQAVQQPVDHPDEISTIFDGAIVYAKGACLIRMLHEYVGDAAFKKGLRLYMNRHKYGNAHTTDLWAALSAACGKNIGAFMDPWLHQPGHPVVKTTVHDDRVELAQERFYSHPSDQKPESPLWPVPLLSPKIQLDVLAAKQAETGITPDFLLLNHEYSGFFHTEYDTRHIARIAQAVAAGKVASTERVGLLLDGLMLTRGGRTSSVELLSLLAGFTKETHYPAWLVMSQIIGALRTLLAGDEGEKDLQRYVGRLARPAYTRLGWEAKKAEPYFDKLLRPLIIGLIAYSRHDTTIKRLLEYFDEAKSPDDLPVDLRTIIYRAAARHKGQMAQKKLLSWYKSTQSAEERRNLCEGLMHTDDPVLISQNLAIMASGDVKLQDVPFWFAAVTRNAEATDIAWNWLRHNWPWVEEKFRSDMFYDEFPRMAATLFCTAEQLRQFEDFFVPKLNERALTRTIQQTIEDIEVRVLWRERDLDAIKNFFLKYRQ